MHIPGGIYLITKMSFYTRRLFFLYVSRHIPYPYPSSYTGTHTFRRVVLVTLLKTKRVGDSDTDIHIHVLLMLFLPFLHGVRSRTVTRPSNHCFFKKDVSGTWTSGNQRRGYWSFSAVEVVNWYRPILIPPPGSTSVNHRSPSHWCIIK